MKDYSIDSSKLIITASFEDMNRKRFVLDQHTTAKSFIDLILSDNSIPKPDEASAYLIKDGDIYESDELLSSKTKEKEFLINVLWNPIVSDENTNLYDYSDTNFDEINLPNDLDFPNQLQNMFEEHFRNIALLRHNTGINAREFINLRYFISGFILAVIGGPFFILIWGCCLNDRSVKLGLIAGLFVWLIIYIFSR